MIGLFKCDLLIVIIQLPLLVLICPKVITLVGFQWFFWVCTSSFLSHMQFLSAQKLRQSQTDIENSFATWLTLILFQFFFWRKPIIFIVVADSTLKCKLIFFQNIFVERKLILNLLKFNFPDFFNLRLGNRICDLISLLLTKFFQLLWVVVIDI